MGHNSRGLVIGAFSFIIGALAVYIAVRVRPEWFIKSQAKPAQPEIFHDFADREREVFKRFNEQFSDDFFRGGDPFENMRKFREEMGRGFAPDEDESFLKDPFDRWFGKKFGGGTINDFSQREDNDFVYYDIKVDDLQSTSINTKVENGYIVISGKQEKKSKEGDSVF